MEMLTSGLTEYVSDEESLARFLNSSRHFNANSQIKHAALLPHNGETLVFRYPVDTTVDTEKKLWEIGEKILPPGRQLHGVAFIQTSYVRKIGLEVLAEEPPPRHANIIKWPSENDKFIEKARQKELAISLAQNALFKKKP